MKPINAIVTLIIFATLIMAISIHANELAIATFDRGIMNELGGSYKSVTSGTSQADFYLDRNVAHGDQGRSLKIIYRNPGDGAGKIEMTLYDETDSPQNSHAFLNMGNYQRLTLWVKGDQGGENFSLEVLPVVKTDMTQVNSAGMITKYLTGGITTQWQEVSIPLPMFSLKQLIITKLIFNFNAPGAGVIYVDNISLKTLDEPMNTVRNAAPEIPPPMPSISEVNSTVKSAINPTSASPAPANPAAMTISSPDSSCKLLEIWNIDNNITTNQGGYYNHFQAGESTITMHLTRRQFRGTNGRSLKLNYTKAAEGFCGIWFHLFNDENLNSTAKYLDISHFPYLSFWVKGEVGGEDFTIQIADPQWLAKEDSKPAGLASEFLGGPLTTEWQEIIVPYRAFKLMSTKASTLVFNFTEKSKGTVYIDDINFKEKPSCSIPFSRESSTPNLPPRQLSRAMWVWFTDKLLFEKDYRREFFAFCKQYQVNELFLQLIYRFENDLTENVSCIISYPEDMRALIKEASSKGILIHALDGYPEYVLSEQHPRVLAQVRSLIEFNRDSPVESRFYGIHLDNEPYQLLGFAGPQSTNILTQFFNLNQKVMDLLKASGSEMVYGIDIPFWFDEAKNDDGSLKYELEFNGARKNAAQHLIDIVDNIGIMDYRNFAGGADGIIKHGESEVNYANKMGKKIYLGVETFKYEPIDVSFVYAVPENNGKITNNNAQSVSFMSNINSFPVRVIRSGNMNLMGLAKTKNIANLIAYNAALMNLYELYGYTRFDPNADLQKLGVWAKGMLKEDGGYNGFTPFEQRKNNGHLSMAGFESIENMHAKITFSGTSKSYMEDVLEEVADAFNTHEHFIGFAIHYYDTYKQLPDRN